MGVYRLPSALFCFSLVSPVHSSRKRFMKKQKRACLRISLKGIRRILLVDGPTAVAEEVDYRLADSVKRFAPVRLAEKRELFP